MTVGRIGKPGAGTPVRRYAGAPVRRYAGTPVRRCPGMLVRRLGVPGPVEHGLGHPVEMTVFPQPSAQHELGVPNSPRDAICQAVE